MALAADETTGAAPPAPEQHAPDASATSGAPPYTVHLPVFEGPLDVLLALIEKNQLEITTVSLVAVTDQFVAYIHALEKPPLPRMAEFVAMAARLLLIKSRSLLPRQPRQQDDAGEADPLDDAEELARHLTEYKRAREIARALRARELAGLQSFARATRLADPEALLTLSPPKLVGLNVKALAHVFKRVLTEKKFTEQEDLPLPVITIAEKMEQVEALLRAEGQIPFEVLLAACETRFAIVVTFLAVLEMWHQARLVVTQDGLFGAIVIRPGPRFSNHKQTSMTHGIAEAVADETAEGGEADPHEPLPMISTSRPRRTRRRKPTPADDGTAEAAAAGA